MAGASRKDFSSRERRSRQARSFWAKILRHCGLWQASTPRAPPDMDGLVLELDAAYSNSSISSSDQADESQELTYVDIDTFLESF